MKFMFSTGCSGTHLQGEDWKCPSVASRLWFVFAPSWVLPCGGKGHQARPTFPSGSGGESPAASELAAPRGEQKGNEMC